MHPAVIIAACNTGNWFQKFQCGLHQPQSGNPAAGGMIFAGIVLAFILLVLAARKPASS